ncbi:MAG: hypothetical protein JNG86_03480 [Verrucomicrobiaceae bacterium]|nr:hypothetical protein [Verrucomicrobiaceae bacterium]
MDFIPSKRNDQLPWWKKISTDITTEGPKFGLAAAAITAAKDVADDQVAKMEATDAAKAALDGARAAEAAATATNEAAIRQMVRNWKTLPGYPASGSEGVLGLRASEPVFDPAAYKTVLKVSVVGGQIKVEFVKGGVDAVAIYARLRGTLGWTKLGEDTSSPYYDTRPLTNPAVPEVREYMAMGVVDNQEIGLPSDIVSVTFAG